MQAAGTGRRRYRSTIGTGLQPLPASIRITINQETIERTDPKIEWKKRYLRSNSKQGQRGERVNPESLHQSAAVPLRDTLHNGEHCFMSLDL